MIRHTFLVLGCAVVLLAACGETPRDVSFRRPAETIKGLPAENQDFTNEAMPKTTDSLEVATGTGASDIVTVSTGSILIGLGTAPVLTVYTDYSCEYCREFAAERQRTMEQEFVDPGEISLRIVFIPHDEAGMLMAKTAICAADQHLFRIVERELAIHPVTGDKDLPALAKRTGANLKQLRTCIAKKPLDAAIRSLAEAAGSTRVPAFTLGNSSWNGLMEHDELSRTIRNALR